MPQIVLLIPLLAAVGGWWAGLVSAWFSDRLLAQDGLASPVGRPWFARDMLVQSGTALVWAALALALDELWQWGIAAVLTVPLVQVAVTDWRHRWVYTLVALAGLVAGVALSPLLHGAQVWAGAAGAAAGYVVFLLLHWLGRLAYRGHDPLARGDVTIAAMVGAIAGPHTATALVLGTLFSGLLGVVVLATQRSTRATMPYGPGLCLGGIVSLFLG